MDFYRDVESVPVGSIIEFPNSIYVFLKIKDITKRQTGLVRLWDGVYCPMSDIEAVFNLSSECKITALSLDNYFNTNEEEEC